MEIKIEDVSKLVQEADKICFTPNAEKTILKLLEIKEQIDDAIHEAKEKIEATALKMSKDFMSVQGDKVKVSYRAYGSRYKIDEAYLDSLPKTLYSKKVSLYPNVIAIDKYASEKGLLPQGILEPERTKQIIFTVKKI